MNPTIPTPDLINSLASWAWCEETAVGQVAFLLLAHPQADTMAAELAGLADALRLAPPERRLPDAGERVLLTGDGRAAVYVEGCPHMVVVEVGPEWEQFTSSGGRIALIVGLAPIAYYAPRAVVESYLGGSALDGRLRLGTAWARSVDKQQR